MNLFVVGFVLLFSKQVCCTINTEVTPDRTPCPSNCAGSCEKDGGMCYKCKNGFFGDTCQSSCPKNCDGQCGRSTGFCYICKARYFGSKCEFQCSPNCDRCDYTGTCISCKEGFHGPDCSKQCPMNCIKCTSDTICIACKDGFYGKTCEHKCPKTCISCTSKTHCTQCRDGYTNRTCSEPCHEACNVCSIDSNSVCTSCSRGRYAIVAFISESIELMYCTKSCSKYCLQGFCESTTGSCLGGCVEGYTGERCTCPENCRNDSCQDSGTCVRGNCDDIFTGKSCACINGPCSDYPCDTCESDMLYVSGDMCCKCPSTCRDGICADENICLNGCVDGFYGDGCTSRCQDFDIWCLSCTAANCSKCLPGYFPSNGRCTACSTSCVYGTCSSADGTCLEGCQDGFWGSDCIKQCDKNCSICNRYNGTCSVCENGKYGRDCASNCSGQCKRSGESAICDIDSGSCNIGCASNKTHGTKCQLECNVTCLGQKCEWDTGKCTTGCIIGYHGEWCENQCSYHCIDRFSCTSTNGTCHVGCKNGFYKHDCRARCAATCINETCEQDTGYCSNGCIEGFTGVSCGEDAEQSIPVTTDGMVDVMPGDTGVMGNMISASAGVTVAIVAGMVVVGAVVFILLAAAVGATVVLIRRRMRHKCDSASIHNVAMAYTNDAQANYVEYLDTASPITETSTDSDAVDTPLSDALDVIYEHIAEEATGGPVHKTNYMNMHPVNTTVEPGENTHEQPDKSRDESQNIASSEMGCSGSQPSEYSTPLECVEYEPPDQIITVTDDTDCIYERIDRLSAFPDDEAVCRQPDQRSLSSTYEKLEHDDKNPTYTPLGRLLYDRSYTKKAFEYVRNVDSEVSY